MLIEIAKRNKLIQELKGVKSQSAKHKKFIALIGEGLYENALLLGCYQCFEDDVQLELLQILLRYTSAFNLSLNVTDDYGKTPLDYAIEQNNIELYFALNVYLPNLPVCKQFSKYQTTRIKPRFQQAFLQEEQDLKDLLAKLVDKEAKTDRENAVFDKSRLIFIIRLIGYIENYLSFSADPNTIIAGELNYTDRQFLRFLQLQDAMKALTAFSLTVANLSGSLRSRYSKCFAPAPFTWRDLEDLGVIMTRSHASEKYSILLENTMTKSSRAFWLERKQQQLIIEAALPAIIAQDLPLLKDFFVRVLQHQELMSNRTSSSLTPELMRSYSNTIEAGIAPVSLVAIKALTRYVNDTNNLINLMHLTHFSDNGIIPRQREAKKDVMWRLEDNYQYRFKLTTLYGKHAALRRLQLIGELLTGKNFSSSIFSYDPSVAWYDFIMIRDAICHQDCGANKETIEKFIAREDVLEHIMSTEIHYFLSRLWNIVALREQQFASRYDGNYEKRWQNILHHEQQQFARQVVDNSIIIPRRVSHEEEKKFITSLEAVGASIEVQNKCRDIFANNGFIITHNEAGEHSVRLASRDEIGKEILQPLSRLRKGNDAEKQLYKTLCTIMDKALKKERTNQDSRAEQRKQKEAEAQQRQCAREKQLIGLESIRFFAEQAKLSFSAVHTMTPEKQVTAAIEALKNIQDFLSIAVYGTIKGNQEVNYTYEQIAAVLAINHEMSDAIEYNAGQLLQYLDAIKDYAEAQSSHFFTESKYEDLRAFRNLIEHGHPWFGRHSFTPRVNPLDIGQRKELIANKLLSLFALMPELQRIKEQQERGKVNKPVEVKRQAPALDPKLIRPAAALHPCLTDNESSPHSSSAQDALFNDVLSARCADVAPKASLSSQLSLFSFLCQRKTQHDTQDTSLAVCSALLNRTERQC